MGKAGKNEEKQFNEQIHSVFRSAGECGFCKKIFVSYGEGEALWLSTDQGQSLVRDLENAKIKFTLKLYPYSDHMTVYTLFPSLLKARLGYYLGLDDEPQNDDDEFAISPEIKLANNLKEVYASLIKAITDIPNDLIPCTEIHNLAHYGDTNLTTALRNFVYIKQGWYWGIGSKEPLKMPDKNAFWRSLPKERIAEGLCFWFQDTILNYYEKKGEPEALEWCVENAGQYLEYICRIADPKHNEHWWNSLRRMHFFIALHKDLNERGIGEKWYQDIFNEIRRTLGFLVSADISVKDPRSQYIRTLGLLHAAIYFKGCGEFYNTLYNAVIEILNRITDFYFDANGVCTFLQVRDQSILAEKLMHNINFINANGFSETKALKTLKRKYDKIVEFTAHITAPNGLLAAVGHSVYEKAWWMQYWLERKTGNYILRDSNIAFLNDKNDLSYITVNGGSNVHSDYKHCDLLAFTWWYDNVQVFTDSEGGRAPLDEFAGSAMAHNGIIVDDLNYVIPSYEDFTAIDTVDERDNCVILTMSHNCYNKVTLRRRLMWIKPNIIVLYDEAESDNEHKYTQNFVLQNWVIDKNDSSRVTVSISPNFTVTISQIAVDESGFELEKFHGTTDVNDESNYRGSLITDWTKLRKGCNLAYTKHGSKVKFLTVIELHGSSNGIAGQENKVSYAKIELDKLEVMLENGVEICEKGLEELRNLTAEKETM